MTAVKPTSASEWAKKPDAVKLPSGKAARLREKVNVYAALRAGVLTQQMVDDFNASQRGELDDAARAMALQDAMVAWLFVEPRCVAGEGDPPKGAIHVNDLDDEDLDFLIDRAFGGAPDEGHFRESDGAAAGEPGGDDAGTEREDLVDASEPAARTRGGDSGSRPARRAPRAKARGTSQRGKRTGK